VAAIEGNTYDQVVWNKRMARPRSSAFFLLVAGLAFTACGGSKSSSRRRCGGGSSRRTWPAKIGAGEGKFTLIAWEGYTQPQWSQALREADGLPGQPKSAARRTRW